MNPVDAIVRKHEHLCVESGIRDVLGKKGCKYEVFTAVLDCEAL